MSQKLVLLLVFGAFLFSACEKETDRSSTKERFSFSSTPLAFEPLKTSNNSIQNQDSSSQDSIPLDSLSSSVEIISSATESSLVIASSSLTSSLSASSASKEVVAEAVLDSFLLIVENASGSGKYLSGDTISIIPEDKVDSGLCFREWEISNSKLLEINENSDTAKVFLAKDSLKVKAVFRSCYEGLASVVIGNLKWTTRNMNIWTFSGSWCYENKRKNCKRYGRLYDYKTANRICRSGWRLPTDEEWNSLAKAVDKEAGLKLKARDGWTAEGERSSNGVDLFGFAGLPAGIFYEGSFLYEGIYAYFWTATEANENMAWFRSLSFDNDEIYRHLNYKQAAYSVRCVQDL